MNVTSDGAWLVGLSAAMFLGALLPGLVPLSFSLSAAKLRLVSVLGAGLLIGTALIVVVPEGIHMFYAAHSEGDHHHEESAASSGEHQEHSHGEDWMIGLALAVGFVLMVFVDRFGGSHGHSHGHMPISIDRDMEKDDDCAPPAPQRVEDVKSWSATFGLGVHAATDGIALGSAALTSNSSLSMIVFMAIMMHKGPAAFGLASFLLNLGLSKNSGSSPPLLPCWSEIHCNAHCVCVCVCCAVRQTVVWFSCVAPVAALLTYFLLSLSGSLNTTWVALLLVFSGGTFLYVATVHILPEFPPATLRRVDVAVFVTGILLPLLPALLSLDHGH